MEGMTQEEKKQIYKDAFKEYMDEKVQEFGYWSIKTLGSVFVAWVTYMAVTHTYIGR